MYYINRAPCEYKAINQIFSPVNEAIQSTSWSRWLYLNQKDTNFKGSHSPYHTDIMVYLYGGPTIASVTTGQSVQLTDSMWQRQWVFNKCKEIRRLKPVTRRAFLLGALMSVKSKSIWYSHMQFHKYYSWCKKNDVVLMCFKVVFEVFILCIVFFKSIFTLAWFILIP